jgi:hypothetical protein
LRSQSSSSPGRSVVWLSSSGESIDTIGVIIRAAQSAYESAARLLAATLVVVGVL